MSADPKCFGVIFESKIEGPLIAESNPMTHEQAVQRMSHFANRGDVIRVAVFRMVNGGWGNETLIEKENDE